MTQHKRKAQTEVSLLSSKRANSSECLANQQSSPSLLDELTSGAACMLSEERYNEAISLTTNGAIKLLELQATAWRKKANNTQELRSTLMMIQLDPHNINAYLRAGELHSIQGNQKAAIAILGQGRKVSMIDKERGLLQERIDAAQARLKKRIDYIIQSPPEIVSNIASFLDMYTVAKVCMHVSLAWHDIFINCPSAWDLLYLSDDRQTTKIDGSLLATVSRHIKKLEVVFSTNAGWDDMLLVTACIFSNLRSLSITGYRYHQRPFANLDILYQLLDNVSPTLTELEVKHWSPRVSIGQILSICPKLTTLKFNLGSTRESFSGMSPLEHPTNLIHISIYSKATVVSSEIFSKFEPLFQQSPSLRYLYVDPMFAPQNGVSIAAQHCPDLAVISTSATSLCRLQKDLSISSTAFDYCRGGGLRVLVLEDIDSVQPLYLHLAKSCNTLQGLHIGTNGFEGTLADWQPLSSLVMQKMTYLSIDHKASHEIFNNQLGPMVRCLPALEILRLSGADRPLSLEASNELFDAMIELSKLSKVHFTQIKMYYQPLTRLLRHHSAKEYSSTLQVLEFDNCSGVHLSVIQQAASIKSLIDLCINYPSRALLRKTDFTEFARLIGRLPRLETLSLSHMTMTDDSARKIAASTSLRYISLTGMNGLTSEGRELLSETIKQVMIRM